ncbi:Integral membrane protein TerC [Rivularia sp. IAM M-261]|nr:Integral membrane protein TerC [Calothrix sp. PCC 7716]GJD19791.1 Integral membrane protein TerC [Rivularia sp. IAM M-261]
MIEHLSGHINLDTVFTFKTFGLLIVLVVLETVLSADNAVALAALVQDIKDPTQQQRALNWGLIIAFILRITLLFTATWVIKFWQFELGGALYLLWLSGKHFWNYFYPEAESGQEITESSKDKSCAFGQLILLIAFTDLAFSIDSVTAAVAVSSQTWLVLTGCIIGIITLRFMAGLFVRWLSEFTYLLDAAYLTVFSVGVRLMFKAIVPDHVPPQWMMLTLIATLFVWGFSKRVVSVNGDGVLQNYEQEG